MDDLMAIERACFPPQMQDSRQNMESFFREPLAAGLILCKDGQAIGYMSGIHICDENSADVLATNQFIKESEEITFYLSNIAILKEYRSVLAVEFLGHEMAMLLKYEGYRYVVAHIRKKTGLSRVAQYRYGAQLLKTYENWAEFDEPFDFIMFELEKVPLLPVAADYCLTCIRKIRNRIKGIPWYG
ncbi:hypothetical protein P4C99_03475 [Pontiellaceae bacterium B1224]|nr:hypothetical protein [Pontiellaceae bacterium B1224]